MKLLQDLYHQQTLTEKSRSKDLSRLPPDIISDIQKNIRDGSKDLEQKWANALELVHKAYKVAGVQRPTPNMEEAWKQYEENIQYAVEQLSKHRGMDGDWRMSAHVFHEALNEATKKKQTYRVTIETPSSHDSYITHADSFDQIIETLQDKDHDLHDMETTQPDEKTVVLKFSKHGIRKNMFVKLQLLRSTM